MNLDNHLRIILQQELEHLKQDIVKILCQPDKEEARMLTRKQVSSYLSIGLSTVDYWSRIGKLRKVKIGNSTRFDKKEIDKALKEQNLALYQDPTRR